MDAHAPWLAEHCDQGRLDLYRARPVTDALKDDLADHPQARDRFLTLRERWFDQAARESPDLLNRTKRHAGRRVSSHPTGDGMAALTAPAVLRRARDFWDGPPEIPDLFAPGDLTQSLTATDRQAAQIPLHDPATSLDRPQVRGDRDRSSHHAFSAPVTGL